jgi:hypothetical protein
MPISANRFGPKPPPNLQFQAICDDRDGLAYRLKEPHSDRIGAIVSFESAVAYRAADEGVLLSYWAAGLANASHLVWELSDTEFLHWLEKVSFRAHLVDDGIRHFLIATSSTCLEVLTSVEPKIEIFDGIDPAKRER